MHIYVVKHDCEVRLKVGLDIFSCNIFYFTMTDLQCQSSLRNAPVA